MDRKLSRRELLRLAASGTALVALTRCMPRALTPTVGPTSPLDSTSLPTIPPSPTPDGRPRLLGNENRPGFYIRYYRRFEPVDRESWRLTVGGQVQNPLTLSLADIETNFPLTIQRSRMKCVEGWSAAAQWEGFLPQELVAQVAPFPEAQWVHFYSADDYYESLPLDEFLRERVLLVYRMNGEPLPDEYGAPLRLIAPAKYAYKGPKALTGVVFANAPLRGYWPTVGPYSEDGEIVPSGDYALDLYDARQHGAGEVFYEDGLESTEI